MESFAMSKMKSHSTVLIPRPYQAELVDKAKNENIIVPLGTGTGKTYIAILLMRELAHDIRKPIDQGGKRAFFLVDKVALAIQQAEQICRETEFRVDLLYGSLFDNINDKESWLQRLKDYEVFVMTSQIYLNCIANAFWKISQANLIIFDECHHALGSSQNNHSFARILEYIAATPTNEQPRVLGLTASIVNDGTQSKPEIFEQKIAELERVMNAKVVSTTDLVTLSNCMAKPRVVLVGHLPYDVAGLHATIDGKLAELLTFLEAVRVRSADEFDGIAAKPCKEALKHCKLVSANLGLWCTWKAICVKIAQLELLKQTASSYAEEQLEFIHLTLTHLIGLRQKLDPCCRFVDSITALINLSTPKMRRLLDTLKCFGVRNGTSNGVADFSGLVFVEQRYVALILKSFLNKAKQLDSDCLGFLQVDYVVGVNSKTVEAQRKENESLFRRLESVMQRFRTAELNLVVATSVLEEGIDVRQCNVVIRFSFPESFRAYVQSKGRARKQNSKFLCLVEETDAINSRGKLQNFHALEQLLLHYCKEKADEEESQGNVPTEDDSVNLNVLIPPYEVKHADGSVATASYQNAITRLNEYCQQLPSDAFTRLTPRRSFSVADEGPIKRFVATLDLPLNSLREPVTGSAQTSKRLAEISAAVKACALLHEHGELNDHLLPVRRKVQRQAPRQDCPLRPRTDEDDSDGEVSNEDGHTNGATTSQPSATSTYVRKVADNLVRPNVVGNQLFVYEIQFACCDASSSFIQPKPKRLGLAVTSKLPCLPEFPLYPNGKLISVRLSSALCEFGCSDNELALLTQFHEVLFRKILYLDNINLSFCPQRSKFGVLVVPLLEEKGTFGIDWPFLMHTLEVLHHEFPVCPSEEQRRKRIHLDTSERFDVDSYYSDAVVCPWYHQSRLPHCYYVSSIVRSKTLSSPFPRVKDYDDFNDYFRKKHNLEIFDQSQPLLAVDFTWNRLGMLCLPVVRVNGQLVVVQSHGHDASSLPVAKKSLLVPELVTKHPLPASVWRMVVCLPSIIYRINGLLLADELRCRVQKDAFGTGEACRANLVASAFEWPALQMDHYGSGYRPTDADSEDDAAENFCVADEESYGSVEKTNRWQTTSRKRGANELAPILPSTGNRRAAVASMPKSVSNKVRASYSCASTSNCVDSSSCANADLAVTLSACISSRNASGGRSVKVILPDDEEVEELAADTTVCDWLLEAEKQMTHRSSQPNSSGNADRDVSVESPTSPVVLPSSSSYKSCNGTAATSVASSNNYSTASSSMPPPPTFVDSSKNSTGSSMPVSSDLSPTSTEDSSDSLHSPIVTPLLDLNFSNSRQRSPMAPRVSVSSLEALLTKNLAQFSSSSGRLRSASLFQKSTASPPLPPPTAAACVALASPPPATVSRGQSPVSSVPSPPRQADSDPFEATRRSGAVWFDSTQDAPKEQRGPDPALLLKALTLLRAHDGINLERLEVLGDSFLKFAVSVHLFLTQPRKHQGFLSCARSDECCNAHLCELGKAKELPTLMAASRFVPAENWIPPGYVVNSNGSRSAAMPSGEGGFFDASMPYEKQKIPDKCIADCVEALIAAYLTSVGADGAVKFMHWMGVSAAVKLNPVTSPLLSSGEQARSDVDELWEKNNLCQLEQKLGYTFRTRAFLIEALTHVSYSYNRLTNCYQRLEFLGDAVLDYMLMRCLYEDTRCFSPAALTDIRCALVNNVNYGRLAIEASLDKKDSTLLLAESECSERETDAIEVPKALSDIFESVAAAIFLDSDCSLLVVWNVYYELLKKQIRDFCLNPPKSPLRQLFELEPGGVSVSKVEFLDDGRVCLTLSIEENGEFRGIGRNRRLAKNAAAKKTLRYIRGLAAARN